MRKLIYFLCCLIVLGITSSAKAQDAYWTEGFESTNITGSSGSAYTTPTAITTETGNWTFYYSYRAGTACEGLKGLRLLKSQTAYAITPVLDAGASKLTFKEPANQNRTLHIYAASTASGDTDWRLLTTVITNNSNAVCANTYQVITSNYASIIEPDDIRRFKIVNEGSTDTNIDEVTIYKAAETISSDVEVLSFKLPGQIGEEIINYGNGTIQLNVAAGTNLSSLAPTAFTLSRGATVAPLVSVPQDFSNENVVNYVVTAQDGTTTKNWTVNVKTILSSEKEITAFQLSNIQIGGASINSATGKILVIMPLGTDVSNLVPLTFQLSAYSNVSPAATAANNFSSPVVYTVTAQDGSTKQWTIAVSFVDPSLTFTAYQAENATFTGKVDAKHSGYTGTGFVDFLTDGENSINFTTCSPAGGMQTAKFRYSLGKEETRTAALFVNDVFIQNVEFPQTASFTDWAEAIVAVNLAAGLNNIKLTWDETDGPNLDKLDLSGAVCQTYSLTVNGTNGGIVTLSPKRVNNAYFEGETVTLLAMNQPALVFENWGGDLSGSNNPQTINITGNKTVTANFRVVNTYQVNVSTTGIGSVTIDPPGGQYAEGTTVTLTANTVLNSVFQGWGGDLTGTNPTHTLVINGNKNVTASFNDDLNIDFHTPIGFASISADGFTGPVTGGNTDGVGTGKDTVYINGPAEFNKLCQILYDRIRYKYRNNNPLTIVLEPGVYPAVGSNGISVWGNHMLDIQEQANLTLIGRKNVTLNFGINIKRSHNIIIRNITFQDYYDDGINIGNTETHHIWVDHCTVGHPTTMPTDSEHPDGGIDIKDGASYVTISWTKYRNSWKTGLVGHSDNNAAKDNGRLKVTYYANHFYNTNSRNPRVRFGEVHVLNNLEEQVKLYGIAASNNSSVYAENNFFLNTRWGMYADRASADFKLVYGNNTDDTFTSKTGNKPANGLKQVGNEYDDSGLPVITAQINPAMLNPGGRSIKFDEFNPELVFDPSSYYSYTAFPASVVRTLIPLFAGADVIDWFPENTTTPLDFLFFNAKADALGKSVKLDWKTTNEINTKEFIIEKRTDEIGFTELGRKASHNTAGIHNYSYTDNQVAAGNTYYRLKQVDQDGKYKYSDIAQVNIRAGINLAVYPNPVDDVLSLSHEIATQASVKVLSLEGRILIREVIPQGATLTSLNVSGLSSGAYLVTLENAGKLATAKFVKK